MRPRVRESAFAYYYCSVAYRIGACCSLQMHDARNTTRRRVLCVVSNHTSVKLTGPSDQEIVLVFFSLVESTTGVCCENASEIPSVTIAQIQIIRTIASRMLRRRTGLYMRVWWIGVVAFGPWTFGEFFSRRRKSILMNLGLTARRWPHWYCREFSDCKSSM